MGKKSHNGLYALAAIVIAAVIFLGPMGGKLPAASVSTSDNTGSVSFGNNNNQGVQSVGLAKGQPVTFNLNHRDSLDQTSRTEATNVKTTLVEPVGNGWNVVGSGTGQTYYIPLNDGMIYASFETQASGQSFVFDPKRTMAANGGLVSGCVYVDIDLDNKKEWTCKISTVGLESQVALSGSVPARTITAYWISENTFTDSAPSDVSSIGTTALTPKYHQYTWTGTEADASYISRIQYKINSTNDAKWTASDMYILLKGDGASYSLVPGSYVDSKGYAYTVTKYYDSDETIYDIVFGYTLDKAKILEFANEGSGLEAVEVKNMWSLAASDVLTTILNIDTLNEIEGPNTQVTDTVNNSA